MAQRELHEYPDVAFSQLLTKDVLVPDTVWRWQHYLAGARETADPIFAAWWAFAELDDEAFSSQAAKITAELKQSKTHCTRGLPPRSANHPPRSKTSPRATRAYRRDRPQMD